MNERELRQRLKQLLEEIRGGIRQDPGRPWGPAERRFQRETFHEIYTIVSQLFSNGHSAAFDGPVESLVISSSDGSWSQLIEFQVGVHDQLIDQQFPLEPRSLCPTVLSAEFQGQRLVLSRRGDHGGAVDCAIVDSDRETSTTSARQLGR